MASRLLAGTLSVLLLSLVSGCAKVGEQTSPPLGGNMQYTGALPPPNHIQENSAISASTMIAPTGS
jgi:hypothetical protein